MLKGKAREDFNKWVDRADLGGIGDFSNCVEMRENYPTDNWNISFTDYPKSMQYGVLVDWFDSVGIRIEVKCKIDNQFNYGIWNSTTWCLVSSEYFDTRPQARYKAIEKANEIYNNRK